MTRNGGNNMTRNGERRSRNLANVRFGYIMVYFLYTSVFSLSPIRNWLDGGRTNAVIYALLAGVGGLLLLVDFFHDQVLFSRKHSVLLVVFIGAMGISTLCNASYGITSNLKTMVWTAVQMFLLLCMDTRQPKERVLRQFRIFGETFCGVWTVAVCYSLWMYLAQVAGVYHLSDVAYGIRTGFVDSRLFGVFSDPNYAAMTSLAAVGLLTLFLTRPGRSRGWRIYYSVSLVLQMCYVILSGSRTAELALAGSCAVVVGFLAWCWMERKGEGKALRLLAAVLGAVLSVALVFGLFSLGKTGLSYAPHAYQTIFPTETTDGEQTLPSNQEEETVVTTPNRVDLTRDDVADSADFSNNRFQIWSDYLKVFATTPIVGTSPRNPNAYVMDHFDNLYINQKQYSVHNSYLAVLVCTGILGTVPMALWLVLVVVDVLGYLIRRRNSRDEYYPLVLGLTGVMAALAIGAFPLLYLFFSNLDLDVIFWVLLGYTLGFIRMSEPENDRPSLARNLTRKLLRKKGDSLHGC